MLDSLPVPTQPAQTSLRLGLPRGFLNEMDVLALRRRITLEARLVSCWPVPPALSFLAPFHQETPYAATWQSPVTGT